MAGVEVVADRTTKEGNIELGAQIGQKMTEMGLWAQLATMASFGESSNIYHDVSRLELTEHSRWCIPIGTASHHNG